MVGVAKKSANLGKGEEEEKIASTNKRNKIDCSPLQCFVFHVSIELSHSLGYSSSLLAARTLSPPPNHLLPWSALNCNAAASRAELNAKGRGKGMKASH